MTDRLLSVSFTITIYFTANLIIIIGKTVNSTYVFYNCVNILTQSTAKFEINCSSTTLIVVESAVIGATDKYTMTSDGSNGCPITNNTCTKNVTFPAELCTGLSRCDIAQRLLFANESNFYCSSANIYNQGANFINVNYSCIPSISASSIFGNICQLEGTFVANNTAYISSYPNFPSGIPPTDAFQCSCMIQPQLMPQTVATVDIKLLLLKLSGIDSSCVEQVTISLGNNNVQILCSPTVNMTEVIKVQLSSNVTIKFDRKSHVSAGTTRFLLELKARNITTVSPVAKISCGFISYPGYPLLNYTSTVKPSTGFSTPTYMSSTSYTSETLATTEPSHNATTTGLGIQTSANSITTQGSFFLNTTTAEHANWSQAVNNSPAESISSGAIAGIVVGSVAAVALILIVAILIIKKRKHIQNQKKLAMGNFLSIYRSVDVNSEQTSRTSVTTSNNTSPYEDADAVLNAHASLRNGAIVEHSTQATVPSKSVYERAQMVNGAAVNTIADSVPVVYSQPMKSKDGENVRSVQESHSGGDGQAAADEGGRQYSNGRQDFAYEQVAADRLTPAEVGHLAFIANREDVIVIDNQLYGGGSRSSPTVSMPIAPTTTEHDHYGNEDERHLDRSNVDQRRSQTDSVYDNARLKSHAPVYYNVLPIENASGVNQPSEEEISNGANQSRDPNDVRKSGVTLIDNTLYGSLLSFAPRSNT